MAAAAPVLPFLSLGLTVVGAIGQFGAAQGQEDAAHESRRMAEMNAAIEEAEAREEERRMVFQAEKEKSRAVALAASSGVTLQGSPGLHIQEMDEVLRDEVDWLRHSSKMRQAQISAQGRYQQMAGLYKAKATRSAAWGRVFGGAKKFGESHNWWMA